MGTKHRGREQWFALVSEYEGSGLSQRAFARERGVNYHTFSNWLRRYRADGEEVVTPVAGFVEVVAVAREMGSVEPARRCQVVLGAVTVEFAELPPPAWLVEVAAVARAR
jgi:transposase-like protein